MATKHEISDEVQLLRNTAPDIVRRKYLKELADFTGRDVILYCTAYTTPQANGVPADALSIITGDVQGFMTALHKMENDKLDIVIHSPGGSVEAVDQIMSYLRTKYSHIRAIVPQNAMSAASMMACACDEIIMGKHSAIGPIDPQITFPMSNGQVCTAPAYSLISEFHKAKTDILGNSQTAPIWIPKLTTWPAGILDVCEKHIKLAKEKVALWLKSYMFMDEENSETISHDIAEWLGNDENHLTHGHPISIKEAEEHGLKVRSLESDQNLQDKVLSVFHASIVTMEMTSCVKIIENHLGVGVFTQIQRK